jgi:ABC-2 type transport system permease protein
MRVACDTPGLSLKPYVATLSARFRMLMQYRAAALAGVVTQVFFGLVRVMIFQAFFQSSAGIQPMSGSQTTSYLWLGQAFLVITMMGVDSELAAMIRAGNVAYDLVRPVDLYNYWLARAFSSRAAPMVMRAIPILLIAAIIGQLHAPASILHGILFLISIGLGLLFSTVLYASVTISLLWTVSGEGAARLVPPLVFFLSGMIIPLPLFPEYLQPIIRALPFRGMIDVPFRIYLGQLAPGGILVGFVQQIVWIVLFILLGRWLVSRGLRRLVAQGG